MEKISRTKIVDVLKREDFGAMVNVKGWVRTRRGSKQVNFIALNDGSTINNVQVVVDLANFDEEMLKDITTGACLSVNGELTESVGSGQKAEIQAREIEVLGTCDNTYPLQKKGHTLEFLREIAHLRPRTNTFGAVFRIRHNMAIAIHTFFHQKGFVYFHTPIITASDCEGAGQMFQVTTKNLYDLKKDEAGSIIYDDDFFGKQASLTVSGQLEGELAATALGAIYTFGPTFRAENSNTPRHLAEFWMVEPEVAFNDITDNMDLAEEFIKFCVKWALDNCADDVKFLNDMFDKGLIERLQDVLKESFVRLGDIRLDKQVEQLQEVTVLGSNEIKMEDKTMYYLTRAQLRHAYNGYNTVEMLMIPGVTANSSSISYFGKNVLLCIDGREATSGEVQNLNPNDIKRIDFYSQSRPDYPEADVIFDYILKERDYAGSVALNANHQLNRLTGNGRGTIQFFEGKSEWTVSVADNYNHFKSHPESVLETTYLFPNEAIVRTDKQLPSSNNNNDLQAYMNYIFKDKKQIFYSSLRMNRKSSDIDNWVSQQYSNNPLLLTKQERRNSTSLNPALQLNYIRDLPRRQKIKLCLYGSHGDNRYDRWYEQREGETAVSAYRNGTDEKSSPSIRDCPGTRFCRQAKIERTTSKKQAKIAKRKFFFL